MKSVKYEIGQEVEVLTPAGHVTHGVVASIQLLMVGNSIANHAVVAGADMHVYYLKC